MINIPKASVAPVNSVDAVPVEFKTSSHLSTAFYDALTRAKDKSATTSSTSPTKSTNNGNINILFNSTLTPNTAHFRIPAVKIDKFEEGLHERALALRSYRQQLLSSNIANADTPGYKAVDIDIQEALKKRNDTDSVQVKYVIPSQGSIDGNTVEIDIERVKFMENAIMYEYEVDQVRGEYKEIEELLKSTPY